MRESCVASALSQNSLGIAQDQDDLGHSAPLISCQAAESPRRNILLMKPQLEALPRRPSAARSLLTGLAFFLPPCLSKISINEAI